MNASLPLGPDGQALLTSPVPLNQRGTTELALSILLMLIATVFVALRLYARKFKGVDFAPDDYLIVAALIFLYGNGISECIAVTLGGRGYHMNQLDPNVITTSLKSLFAAALSWTFSTSAIKISLLLLYIRVFPQRAFRLTAYALMGVVAVYCVGCVIFYVGNCRPIQANWTPDLPGAVCGKQQAGWLGTGIANIITDVVILSLPMRSVYYLQVPRRTKAAVAGIFGIGFITLVVSIARLATLLQIDLDDFTYTAVPADIFSAFEPTLMIVCACLPIMRPLFRNFLPTNSRSRYGQNYHPERSNTNRHGRINIISDAHKKQLKSKEAQNKHKNIALVGSDGFEMLTDVDSKPQSVVSGEPDEGRVGRHPTEKLGWAATVIGSRTQSPSLSRREREREAERSQTPVPLNGIEVTREWTVELEASPQR